MTSAIAQSYSCHPVSISAQEAEAARHVGTLIRDVLPQLSACHCLALSCPSWSISPGYKRRVIDQWQWRGEKKRREGERDDSRRHVRSLSKGKKRDEPQGMKRDCVLWCLCCSSLQTEVCKPANLLHCGLAGRAAVMWWKRSCFHLLLVCMCILNGILIYWCDREALGGLSGLSHPWIFFSPYRLSKHCSNVWPRIHWFRPKLQLPIPW